MTKAIAVKQETMISPFGSIESFETCQRMAKALAASTFVPKEFRNNIGDCLILLETASRTGMPIMALMQNMYVVYGKPSFSSAFMAGLINSSDRFDEPLQFTYNDDRSACYAHTIKDGKEYRGITVTMGMAKKEGWVSKKGSKWQTMPELMLQYRATSFFARAYCADLIMGMRSQDELLDQGQQISASVADEPVADLNDRFGGKAETIDTKTGVINQDTQPDPFTEGMPDKTEPLGDRLKNENAKREAGRKAAIDGFKADIDAIKNIAHLNNWRQKHFKRIERELPVKADQMIIHDYAEARNKLLVEEANPTPPPQEYAPNDERPPVREHHTHHNPHNGAQMISCPDGNGNVPLDYCNDECKSRQGCPAHDDAPQSKLNIDI